MELLSVNTATMASSLRLYPKWIMLLLVTLLFFTIVNVWMMIHDGGTITYFDKYGQNDDHRRNYHDGNGFLSSLVFLSSSSSLWFVTNTSSNEKMNNNSSNNDHSHCYQCLVTKEVIEQHFLIEDHDHDDATMQSLLELHHQLAQQYHVVPIRPRQSYQQQQQKKKQLASSINQFKQRQVLEEEVIRTDNYDNNENDYIHIDEYYYTHMNMEDCPCDDKRYCYPITGIPPVGDQEMYGFYEGGAHEYFHYETDINFTYVTSIAWAYRQPAIICTAHPHGVRVIDPSSSTNLTYFTTNTTALFEWIYMSLATVQQHYRDGIVFDFEDPLPENSIESKTYVKLIYYTKLIFQLYNPSYQITTCIAWSPDSIDGRSFLHYNISLVSDIVYVMVYDVQSQIYTTTCIANANSPYYAMVHGILRYIELGVDPKKIIVGVPWYGYRYPCQVSSSTTTPNYNFHERYYCALEYRPFRGIPCSDAIGGEYDYSIIMERYYTNRNQTTILWDDNTKSPFFTIMDTNTSTVNSTTMMIYQYWFDNADSTRYKYQWAKQQQLLGVGPFTMNNVNYHHSAQSKQDAIDMWSALDDFYL